jgi:hypothetical protein
VNSSFKSKSPPVRLHPAQTYPTIQHPTIMSSPNAPQGPYKLVSVNKAPERATRLIGRIVDDVKHKYTIIHSANADSEYSLVDHVCWIYPIPCLVSLADTEIGIEDVAPLVSEHEPDLLVSRRLSSLPLIHLSTSFLGKSLLDYFSSIPIPLSHSASAAAKSSSCSSALLCGLQPRVHTSKR